jgi:hypothetical protein
VDRSPMYTEPNLVINIILEAARETLCITNLTSDSNT